MKCADRQPQRVQHNIMYRVVESNVYRKFNLQKLRTQLRRLHSCCPFDFDRQLTAHGAHGRHQAHESVTQNALPIRETAARQPVSRTCNAPKQEKRHIAHLIEQTFSTNLLVKPRNHVGCAARLSAMSCIPHQRPTSPLKFVVAPVSVSL